MLKKIFKVLKKAIFSVFLIYSYNIIAEPLGLIIPINLITIFLVTILGVPALFALIAVLIIIF
ncbi:MAG: pro-sigmaK processing inhibitor BofA family protein [Bacilli bacterium]|nr:pro-sigmaK processing inhibitor BofA family protein [Bacilli bacterium]MDD4733256.1 pro-sigmaK processing inhibitor BofA family protein [Bacilli bacterium]